MSAIRVGAWTVDTVTRRAARLGESILLTPYEAALLAYLGARPGQLVSFDELHRTVWEHHPNVRSRAAYFTFRRLAEKLEADPSSLVLVPSAGVRYDPPATPASTGTFVGRDAEIAALEAACAIPRTLVTVVGLGGVGKTALVQVWLSRHPRPTLWIDLHGTSFPEALVDAIERTGPASHAGLGVIVVDEAENLTDVGGCIAQIRSRFGAVPLVITARRAIPDATVRIALGGLDEDAACALLAAEAAAAGVRLGAAEQRRIVQGLGGHPAALRLVGANCDVLDLETLLGEARRRVLPAAAWALERLDADESRCIRLLAALVVPVAFGVVDRIVPRAMATVASLVRYGLVVQEGGRVWVHAAVRDALEPLPPADLVQVAQGLVAIVAESPTAGLALVRLAPALRVRDRIAHLCIPSIPEVASTQLRAILSDAIEQGDRDAIFSGLRAALIVPRTSVPLDKLRALRSVARDGDDALAADMMLALRWPELATSEADALLARLWAAMDARPLDHVWRGQFLVTAAAHAWCRPAVLEAVLAQIADMLAHTAPYYGTATLGLLRATLLALDGDLGEARELLRHDDPDAPLRLNLWMLRNLLALLDDDMDTQAIALEALAEHPSLRARAWHHAELAMVAWGHGDTTTATAQAAVAWDLAAPRTSDPEARLAIAAVSGLWLRHDAASFARARQWAQDLPPLPLPAPDLRSGLDALLALDAGDAEPLDRCIAELESVRFAAVQAATLRRLRRMLAPVAP